MPDAQPPLTEHPDVPRIILVAGPSGAGKTVLSSALASAMGASHCVRISLDDYYADVGELSEAERADINFDRPDAIDWALLREHLRALLAGRTIQKPCYDFASHCRVALTEFVRPLRYIVFDGIHALSDDALVSSAELTIYVDASRETCSARRLARDVSERGRSATSVRDQFDGTVWPMAEQYILPLRERADVIVPGDDYIEETIPMLLHRIGFLQ